MHDTYAHAYPCCNLVLEKNVGFLFLVIRNLEFESVNLNRNEIKCKRHQFSLIVGFNAV